MCMLLKLHYAKFDVSRLFHSKVIEKKSYLLGGWLLFRLISWWLCGVQMGWGLMDFGVDPTVNWSVSVNVGDQQRLIFLHDICAGHCQSSDSTSIVVDLPSLKH